MEFGLCTTTIMARKRQFEEIDSVKSVSEPVLGACIDGVVTGLSIVKKGKKNSYFNGSVSDGKTNLAEDCGISRRAA